jgi:hypothetical protein
VARPWLAAGACFLLACSPADPGLVPQDGSATASVHQGPGAGRERIPAEWTVAEDTSIAGDVTTISLQLPSAKDIGGLADEEAPRLILRCVDGRVQAFIDTETATGEPGMQGAQSVQVQLDSAPPCE